MKRQWFYLQVKREFFFCFLWSPCVFLSMENPLQFLFLFTWWKRATYFYVFFCLSSKYCIFYFLFDCNSTKETDWIWFTYLQLKCLIWISSCLWGWRFNIFCMFSKNNNSLVWCLFTVMCTFINIMDKSFIFFECKKKMKDLFSFFYSFGQGKILFW